MATIRYTGDALWERIERAVERIKDRMRRATRALAGAGLPYAVAGGNAVQLWVAQVDEAAVRNTRDVDILLRRDDLAAAIDALGKAGFIFREINGVSMFLDGPEAGPRDAVHVIFSNEKVRPDHLHPAPDVSEQAIIDRTSAVSLEALVRMKLVSFRRRDQVHLLDMLEVALIDESWLARIPEDLRPRLRELIETPDE
ncbi:MAG: hypothetical protein HYX69_06395 [Planctomycetia bacterium]|nr:hypothetical protein [Planctomycetia bacterium]